jgi:hypothetical protein
MLQNNSHCIKFQRVTLAWPSLGILDGPSAFGLSLSSLNYFFSTSSILSNNHNFGGSRVGRAVFRLILSGQLSAEECQLSRNGLPAIADW